MHKKRIRRSRLLDTEDFLHDSGPLISARSHYIPYPSANVKEEESYYDLELAVPGFKKEEIEITLGENLLSIQGIKKSNKERDDVKFIRKEHDLESFERVFELDDITDLTRIEASYSEGMLKVRLHHIDERTKNRVAPIQVEVM